MKFVKLIGNLDMPKTRKAIKAQLKGLNNLTFNITPNVNTKGVQSATKQAINNAQRVANNNKVHLNFDTSKQQLVNQIKILGRNNNKLFNNHEMTAKYNQLLNAANVAKSTGELKTLRGELSAFKTELVATNNAGMTWGSKFKESVKSYTKFFSGASLVYAIANQVRNVATEAKTLDDSLVNLQKVTDEIADRDALYKYFDKSLSKAQELNVKVGSLIDAVTEFKKLGWSLDDAELGAKWANILSNVGDVDIDTAIGSIKTSIASFDEIGGYTDDQMDKKLEAYTDLINNMSNKYSIDAEGLAESIRLSAGTLTEAHMSIEQAATMFATANKYYSDPSYLGHTAKIGSLRMRASSGDTDAIEELQEMGEEVDNLATATSNLREKLMALTGVDIMEDEHTFKSYYDQLYEISQVMDKLDDTSRANVLETMFGKSRSAAGAAILSGMKESASAYEDAINSAGSATKEYQTWMTGADAACQNFSNTLTETYQGIINGNTVRDLANLGSAVLEFANNWGIVEGTLKGVIALGIGKFLTTGTMALITATKQVEQYGKALQMASNVPNGNLSAGFQALKSIAQAISTLTTEQLRNVLATNTLTQADRVRILQMQDMTKEMALQKLAEMNLTQATNAQTAANTASIVSTFSLKAAMTGLGATIKSVFLNNPAGIVLMGISLGVSAVTSAVSKHNQAVEEARQKAKEAADNANTIGDEIAELANKYIQLSDAVKTDASAKEDLMTTQTELLKKLGLEGESIDDLIAKYGSLSNAIKQASIDSLKDQQIDLVAGVNAAKEDLMKVAKNNFWGTNNIISASGEEAVKAFKELEKAGVIDSGSYGTGGGQLVLIGDDTVEGALENYKKLEDAVNALRDSEAFTGDELSDNSLFNSIYSRYSEMKESVEAYNSSIDNLNENLAQQTMLTALQGNELPKTEEDFNTFKQELIDTAVASKQFIGNEKEITDAINNYLSTVPEFEGYYSIPLENELDKVDELLNQEDFSKTSFSDAWSALDNVDSDSPYKDAKKDLMELADAGQLTAEKLKTVSGAEEYFKKIGMSAKDTADEINKLSDESTQLASMATQVSKMSDALATKADKGVVEYSTLSGFDAEVKGLDSWDKFQSLLGSSKSSMKECQAAANALATEWVNSNNFLANLNETNKNYYITQLDLMGVENAEKLVTDSLSSSKEALSLKYQALNALLTDFNGKTNNACQSLFNEQTSTDQARYALANLVSQEIIFNNTGLDVAGKISALNQLAYAAYGVSNALNGGMGLDSKYYNGKTAEERLQEKWNIISSANASVNATPVSVSPTGSSGYSGSKNKDSGSGAKDKAEETVKQFYSVFDWMEKKIKYLEHITEKAIERISDSLQYAMDKSYISNTFKKINEQMATNAYMVQRYKKSADAVGLADEDLKNKIKNGGNIDYYKDHNMHDDFGHVYDEDLNNKITAYADWIDKSLEAAEANETLKKSVKELAETISQAPIDKAANKVEKYDSSTELIEAKVDHYKSAKNKNKQLDIKSSNIDKTLSSYKTAYNTTKSNEKSYEKKITKQKVAKGATNKQKSKFKSLMAKVKFAAKGKKKISDKTLESIYSYCASVKDFTWYQNAVTYNSSIEAMDSAKQTYDLYKQTFKKDKREIAKEKFDNVVTEYDNKIGLIDNGITDIDNKLALTEAKGMLVNTNYYKQQKAIKAEEQSYYQQELQRLQELANGIEKGTQEWYDAQSSIQDCKNSISECTKAQLEYNNAINEADVTKYEKISELISRTSTEMEFLEKLMSHDKMYDDNGAFTESGIATLGTYAMSYYDNLQNANRDRAELDRLKGMLASGNLGTYNSVEQLQQRIDELYDTWQDDISATYSAQESIFDMMSDKFNAELDALQELVDRRRESLELSKEIFDYQNKISEKTKSINTLQKQIAAYKGDTSQEGRAKLQKLQVELSQEKDSLKNEEYSKYISDQEKLLDKLLDEFKENIEKRLEDFKKVVNDGLTLANANSADILSHLRSVSSENGYIMQYSPATSTTLQGYVNTIVAAINSRTTTAIDNPDTNNGGGDTTFTHPTIPATNEDRRHDAIEKDKLEYANKVAKEQKLVSEYKDKTIAFIKENGKKTSKEPSDAVNKVIYKKYGKKYLSTKQLKNLAKILDVKYDNASKTGNLYQRLQALNVKGFKHGGIGRLVKSKGEDGLAMVRNGEGLVAPEHVKDIQELLKLTPVMTDMIKVNQPDYTKLASMVLPVKSNIGDVQFNFELTECENAQDIIKQIQTDTKIQNALRSVTTDQMLGAKRSNTNRIV